MSEQIAKDLMEKKKQLTEKLNRQIMETFKRIEIEQFLNPKRSFLKQIKSPVLEILAIEAQIHEQQHKNLLFEVSNLDNYLIDLIQRHTPKQSGKPEKIRRFLEEICDKITAEYPAFACKLLGVGSHHDGTKMFKFDEMDFILLLKFEPDTDYKVRNVPHDPIAYNIVVSKESNLAGSLSEEFITKKNLLKVKEYRDKFVNVLENVIHEIIVHSEMKIGGWNHPDFGGFTENGPALTFVVDDVSIDITLAWRAPSHITEDVLMWALFYNHEVELWSPSWKVVEQKEKFKDDKSVFARTFGKYTELGLLVTSGQDHCEMSTSEIETCIIKTNESLKKALSVFKIYKYKLFDLSWPDLTDAYTSLKGNIFNWIVDKLKTGVGSGVEVVEPIAKRALTIASGMSAADNYQILALLVLAAKDQPDTEDRDISEKLQSIRDYLHDIFIKIRSNGQFYPSLYELLGEERKTMIQIKSFIFKSLIIETWSKSQKEMLTTSDLVISVMRRYLELHKSCVEHPLLHVKIRVQKIHSLCNYFDIENETRKIQCESAAAIINQVLDVSRKQ